MNGITESGSGSRETLADYDDGTIAGKDVTRVLFALLSPAVADRRERKVKPPDRLVDCCIVVTRPAKRREAGIFLKRRGDNWSPPCNAVGE